MRVMPDDRRRLEAALADGTLAPMMTRAVSHAMPDRFRRTAAEQEVEILDLVEKMTNWQRTQWNRAGNPREPAAVRHFATMDHRKADG